MKLEEETKKNFVLIIVNSSSANLESVIIGDYCYLSTPKSLFFFFSFSFH